MKRILLIAIVFLVFIFGKLCFADPLQLPIIYVDNIDFGIINIKTTKSISKKIEIKNIGYSDLEINGIIQIKNKEISIPELDPMISSIIIPAKGIYNTSIIIKPTKIGYFEDSVIIKSNAGDNQKNVFTIKYNVVADSLYTDNISWGKCRALNPGFPDPLYFYHPKQLLISNIGKSVSEIRFDSIEVISGNKNSFYVDYNGTFQKIEEFFTYHFGGLISIFPNQDLKFTVYFRPEVVCENKIILYFEKMYADSNNKFLKIELSGIGTLPNIRIDSLLTFDNTTIEDVNSKSLRYRYIFNDTIGVDYPDCVDTLNIFSFDGGKKVSISDSIYGTEGFMFDEPFFSQGGSGNIKIAPGEIRQIRAFFKAPSLGLHSATFKINSDANLKNNANISTWVGTGITNSDIEYQLNENNNELLISPNPAAFGTASIKFKVNHSGRTTLKLINVFGETELLLLDRELSEGIYNQNFNIENLTNGVYFVELRNRNDRYMKKLVIFK